MRTSRAAKWILPFCLLLGACTSSTCPSDTISYLTAPYPTERADASLEEQRIEIGRQEVLVDEVITEDFCNDSLSGVVYVTCDIQIPAWEEEALFLQDCDLKIKDGTVIYVEAHGNQAYYEGCSCHE
ncbi:MAG: hypothetical protein P8Z34_04650 [Anaerolineales bacterium]